MKHLGKSADNSQDVAHRKEVKALKDELTQLINSKDTSSSLETANGKILTLETKVADLEKKLLDYSNRVVYDGAYPMRFTMLVTDYSAEKGTKKWKGYLAMSYSQGTIDNNDHFEFDTVIEDNITFDQKQYRSEKYPRVNSCPYSSPRLDEVEAEKLGLHFYGFDFVVNNILAYTDTEKNLYGRRIIPIGFPNIPKINGDLSANGSRLMEEGNLTPDSFFYFDKKYNFHFSGGLFNMKGGVNYPGRGNITDTYLRFMSFYRLPASNPNIDNSFRKQPKWGGIISMDYTMQNHDSRKRINTITEAEEGYYIRSFFGFNGIFKVEYYTLTFSVMGNFPRNINEMIKKNVIYSPSITGNWNYFLNNGTCIKIPPTTITNNGSDMERRHVVIDWELAEYIKSSWTGSETDPDPEQWRSFCYQFGEQFNGGGMISKSSFMGLASQEISIQVKIHYIDSMYPNFVVGETMHKIYSHSELKGERRVVIMDKEKVFLTIQMGGNNFPSFTYTCRANPNTGIYEGISYRYWLDAAKNLALPGITQCPNYGQGTMSHQILYPWKETYGNDITFAGGLQYGMDYRKLFGITHGGTLVKKGYGFGDTNQDNFYDPKDFVSYTGITVDMVRNATRERPILVYHYHNLIGKTPRLYSITSRTQYHPREIINYFDATKAGVARYEGCKFEQGTYQYELFHDGENVILKYTIYGLNESTGEVLYDVETTTFFQFVKEYYLQKGMNIEST